MNKAYQKYMLQGGNTMEWIIDFFKSNPFSHLLLSYAIEKGFGGRTMNNSYIISKMNEFMFQLNGKMGAWLSKKLPVITDI